MYFSKILILSTAFILFFSTYTHANSKARNVLYIGDSHSCMDFGKKLDKLLRSRSDLQITRIASGGTRTDHWLEGNTTGWGYCIQEVSQKSKQVKSKTLPAKMEELLSKYQTDDIIVALGSNGQTLESAKQLIALLVPKVKQGGHCAWILPPKMILKQRSDANSTADEKIDKILKPRDIAIMNANEAFGGPCKIIESRKAPVMSTLTTKDFDKEEIHMNNKNGAANKWAEFVFAEINLSWPNLVSK